MTIDLYRTMKQGKGKSKNKQSKESISEKSKLYIVKKISQKKIACQKL